MSKGYISSTDRRFMADMERYLSQQGKLHHSHRTWIARHLVAAGKTVPADDRAMLDAVRGI